MALLSRPPRLRHLELKCSSVSRVARGHWPPTQPCRPSGGRTEHLPLWQPRSVAWFPPPSPRATRLRRSRRRSVASSASSNPSRCPPAAPGHERSTTKNSRLQAKGRRWRRRRRRKKTMVPPSMPSLPAPSKSRSGPTVRSMPRPVPIRRFRRRARAAHRAHSSSSTATLLRPRPQRLSSSLTRFDWSATAAASCATRRRWRPRGRRRRTETGPRARGLPCRAGGPVRPVVIWPSPTIGNAVSWPRFARARLDGARSRRPGNAPAPSSSVSRETAGNSSYVSGVVLLLRVCVPACSWPPSASEVQARRRGRSCSE